MHQPSFHNHRAIATIATLLFSINGLAHIRPITKTHTAQPEISEPGRDERVQRILAVANSQRQAKLARRAARHRPAGAMITCPRCKGAGARFSVSCRPQDCNLGNRNCSTCGGDGSITKDHASRIKIGQTMRQERIHRNATIREDATRLHCNFAEWSRIEFGRAPETAAGLAAYSQRIGELNDSRA